MELVRSIGIDPIRDLAASLMLFFPPKMRVRSFRAACQSGGAQMWKGLSTLGMVGDEQDMRQYLIPAEEMVPEASRVRWLLRYSEELERLILA